MTYASNLASAKRMMAAKGQPATLTAHEPGAYNTSTGTATLADTQVTTVGVVLPLSRGLANMTGSTVQAGDQQLLLPGDVDVSIDMTVTLGGVDYTIVEVKPLSPGGTVILNDCTIRGVA